MKSHFAPAARKGEKELRDEIEFISNNPVIDTLLESVTGLLAVLNEERQILAVNNKFLETLGVDDAGAVLGLRPGEALKCDHAHDMPGGCGTSRFCAKCDAAIAVVTALKANRPEERDCMIEVSRGDKLADLYLRVKAYPLSLRGKTLVLLFVQDITGRQNKAIADRVYFHDVENTISSLYKTVDEFEHQNDLDVIKFAKDVEQLTLKLGKEVEIQRVVSDPEFSESVHPMRGVSVHRVFEELRSLFSGHPSAKGKHILFPEDPPDYVIKTDLALLVRILAGMVTNALEATRWDGSARIWIEPAENTIAFCVWNKEMIRKKVAKRIFKRNFTTKKEAGRGFGTYSMKYLGERYLKGKVSFETSPTGTTFRLELPMELQPAAADAG